MSTENVLERLEDLRVQFGRRAARERARLLARTIELDLARAADILRLHELLLFSLAYPDNAEVHRLAMAALKHVAQASRELMKSGPQRERTRLCDSGIAHTVTTHAYSFETTRWLAARYPRQVELAWEDDDSLGAAMDDLLPSLIVRAEGDGLLNTALSTRAWFRLARGGDRDSDLSWFLRQFARIPIEGPARDRLFESLGLYVRWRLKDRRASRTFQRFPKGGTFHQTEPPLRQFDIAAIIDEPLPAPRALPSKDAMHLIDLGRSAVFGRHRETDPMTYANPREVYPIRLDRGLDVTIYGMLPARRLPIESFFGYVAARNGLPMAYGGGWVLGDRCEIGINVFETFRGGESAYCFAQLLRVYRNLFGATRFTVDPYQFGADNPEAIRSGAFWFYYRFGFRPVDAKLRKGAAEEWTKIQAKRSYRTPATTLRRFARDRLLLVLDDDRGQDAPDLPMIGTAVTDWIGRRFEGDRAAAASACTRQVARQLDAHGLDGWPPEELRTFTEMSVLASMVPDLTSWTPADKRSLSTLFRAKGGPRERRYARLLRGHRRFREALYAIAARGARVR